MIADMRWEISIILLPVLFVIANSTTVELTQEWKPELGWVITCSWTFSGNDKLQSVSMNKDTQLFMNYRPGTHGPRSLRTWSLPDYQMNIECKEDQAQCVLTMEPNQPPRNNLIFTCEVSGERPRFLTDEKTLVVEAMVAPTDAELAVSRATVEANPVLNCSSSGLPAPNLVWTVGDAEVKVPANFRSSKSWNATSKLWYAWSTFMPSDDTLPVVCTPKVAKDGRQIDGKPAMYNSEVYSGAIGTFGNLIYTTLRASATKDRHRKDKEGQGPFGGGSTQSSVDQIACKFDFRKITPEPINPQLGFLIKTTNENNNGN